MLESNTNANHTHIPCPLCSDGDAVDDFVFEEFVRLRVAGVEEGTNETEA